MTLTKQQIIEQLELSIEQLNSLLNDRDVYDCNITEDISTKIQSDISTASYSKSKLYTSIIAISIEEELKNNK